VKIISTISALRAHLKNERSIAFVPTMGNLHQGHLELMRQARQCGQCVVASIFVNPLQFGPNEDFDHYPRTWDADCAKLQGLADVVFAPLVNEMYPVQQNIFVELPAIADELCGAARPGHFRGMVTVVLKLLNIVQPTVALFGKKDYQQLHIIQQLVWQFNLPVQIVAGETIRAEDGLALSSRNQYLSASERIEAPVLQQTLQALHLKIAQGEKNYEVLQQHAVASLTARGWQVDYVSIRNQQDLQAASPDNHDLVILAAARLGRTRLLDNIELTVKS
jgi:pantoate--beta-alanine ligase